MNPDFLVLAGRIKQEIEDLQKIIARADRASRNARKNAEDADLYIDAAALNLHDFYTGLERIFSQIAVTVDKSTPAGADWHRELLNQMCIDVPGVRPPVFSQQSCAALQDFMRFRHVVRNVYAFNLDGERVAQLTANGRALMKQITVEMESFVGFLTRSGGLD